MENNAQVVPDQFNDPRSSPTGATTPVSMYLYSSIEEMRR